MFSPQQASKINTFMNGLPNTNVPVIDFNDPANFNERALALLNLIVFPIRGVLFIMGKAYSVMKFLREAGYVCNDRSGGGHGERPCCGRVC